MPEVTSTQDNDRIIIQTKEAVYNVLKTLLKQEKLEDIYNFEPCDKNIILLRTQNDELIFDLPVRLGEIIDQIIALTKKMHTSNLENITLEHGILNIPLGTFTPSTTDSLITLTEKEISLLQYLYENAGRNIPRDELLEAVWEYAKDTETHTLETHIYRLRQKIEPDPATPVILKKNEDGYYLAGLKNTQNNK
ncbi:MAG: helix-turn-helix domain-containing protein [Alphaproteobacteria bacterium]